MAGGSETATLETRPGGDNSSEEVTGFGRYVVRGRLGRGGMGEVFLAHDPELDRAVAVKVIRETAERSAEARARFQREAQVLARLNHPNVVAVHDVGTVGDTIYVAMEYIEGPTLARWLADAPRSLDDILDVFVQAGQGLAAAHDAGIVHRDFKPANVMLGDRVRVVDFGLARSDGAVDALASTVDEAGAADDTITAAGRVLGTPAFMAPEQRGAQRSGPAADQYSFAVALRGAVTASGPPPRWLQRILTRALSFEPEHRYASMRDVLRAIDNGRSRSRRWATVVFAAAASGGILGLWRFAADAPEPCPDPAPQVASVWGPPQRTAVRDAFLATAQPYAELTWRNVERALDRYTSQWIEASLDACRATRQQHSLSQHALDLRSACLERARGELAAQVQQWIAGTDANALAKATTAVTSLPSIAACNDIDSLLGRVAPPTDAVAVAKIAEVRAELDKLLALSRSGRYEQVAAAIPTLLPAADATGWTQLRAEVRLLQGRAAANLLKPEAEQSLLVANQLATEARDDRLAAQSLVELVRVLGADADTAPRALLVAALADAAIVRLHGDRRLQMLLLRHRAGALETLEQQVDAKPLLLEAQAIATAAFGAESQEVAEIQLKLATVLRGTDEVAAARTLAETALARLTALVGAEHPLVGSALNELAATASVLSDYDAVVDYMTRSMTILARTSGEDSIAMARARWNLASTQVLRGKYDEAEHLYTQSLETRQRLLGDDHVAVAASLEGLAQVRQWRGQLEDALQLEQRALAIKTKVLGPEHPDIAQSLMLLGLTLANNGRREEALTYFKRALALRIRVLGAEHPATLESEVLMSSSLALLDRCAEARPLVAHAIAALEHLGGDASEALEVRAECELAAGDAPGAATTALRAITACEATGKDNPMCSSRYWVRARALAKLGKTEDAIAAATEAAKRADSNESPEEAREIRAWIAKRRRP